jgi:hypothetical protein
MYETMLRDTCVLEVDPIHRRILLGVSGRGGCSSGMFTTLSKIHTEDGDVVDVPMDIPADD